MSNLYNWIKGHKFISSVSAILLVLVCVYTVLMAQFVMVLNNFI